LLPLIWPECGTGSEMAGAGLIFARDIGVNGGESTSPGLYDTWEESKSLETCTDMALWLLEGIEKLRGTIKGGGGRGDAKFAAPVEILLVPASSGFLDNGAECPISTEGFAALAAKLPGGLGSSWSSLILGEETRGGDVLGDTLGDEEGWGFAPRDSIPETCCESSVEEMGPLDDKGFIDHGLLVIGPEKDCHLFFL